MGRSARSTSTEANDGTAHCEERSPLPRPLPRMRRKGGHTAGPHRTRLTPGGRRGRLSQPYCASPVPRTSAGKLSRKRLEPEGCEERGPAGRREGVLTSRRHARLCSDEQVFQLRNNLKRWASPVTLYPTTNNLLPGPRTRGCGGFPSVFPGSSYRAPCDAPHRIGTAPE